MSDIALAHPAERVLFAATLRPHRTLSRIGALWLGAAYCACFGVAAIPFFALKFWPIVIYLFGTAGLLCYALKRNFYDARAYEAVRLSYLDLQLRRVNPRGKAQEFDFPPAYVRLVKEEHPDFGLERLAFAWRAREVEVAGMLCRTERARFACDLTCALQEARRGPIYRP